MEKRNFSRSELEQLIAHIPVKEYASYNPWLGMAGTFKAAGLDFDVFHRWSQGDPEKYKDEADCLNAWGIEPNEDSDMAINVLKKTAREKGSFKLPASSPDTSNHSKQSDEMVIPTSPPEKMPEFIEDKAFIDAKRIIKEVHGDRPYATGFLEKTVVNQTVEIGFIDDDDLRGVMTPDSGVAVEMFWQLNEVELSEKGSVQKDLVKTFTWGLLECDTLSLDEQYQLLKMVKLPMLAGVYSGGKSIHVFVHVGAMDAAEYRERLDIIYKYAKDHGFDADEACKSIGRWVRFPVGYRAPNFQYPVIVNEEYLTYDGWLEAVKSELPENLVPKELQNLIPLTPAEVAGEKSEIRWTHLERFIAEEETQGTIRFNEISRKIECQGFKWIPRGPNDDILERLADEMVAFLKPRYKGVNFTTVCRLMAAVAKANRYNPITEQLEAVTWDGKDRFEKVCQVLGVENEFSKSLIGKWLVQGVAMLYNEGKYGAEGVLTIQGEEGIGKTTFFRSLVPDIKWFQEGVTIDMENKDSIIYATEKWITEIGECDATTKKLQANLKAFITKSSDAIRPVYEKVYPEFPRKTSFCATLNVAQFLSDGKNRRWWVIKVDKIDNNLLDELKSEIWQLWAQAKYTWDKDKNYFRLNLHEQDKLAEMNLALKVKLPYEEQIEEYFDWETPVGLWEWMTRPAIRDMFKDITPREVNRFGQALNRVMGDRNVEKKRVHGIDCFLVPPKRNSESQE